MQGGRWSHDQRSLFAQGHDHLFYATANQFPRKFFGFNNCIWTSNGEHFGFGLVRGENIYQLQNGRRKRADRSRIENRDGTTRASKTQSRLGRRYGNFELSQYDRGRFEGGGAAGNVVSGEKFIRSRIDYDAVIAGLTLDYDETNSSGCVVR